MEQSLMDTLDNAPVIPVQDLTVDELTPDEDKCGICFEHINQATERYAIITEESNAIYHIECVNTWHKKVGSRGLVKTHISTVEIYDCGNLVESRYVVENQSVVIKQPELIPLINLNRPARLRNQRWQECTGCQMLVPLLCYLSCCICLIIFTVKKMA